MDLASSIGATERQTRRVLARLRRQGVLERHDLRIRIYVPRSNAGRERLREIARTSFIIFPSLPSPFILISSMFLLVLIWISPIETVLYKLGIASGVMLGGSINLMTISGFDWLTTSFRKWQLLSTSYPVVIRITRWFSTLFIPLLAIYLIASIFANRSIETTVVLSLALLSVALAALYNQMSKPKD